MATLRDRQTDSLGPGKGDTPRPGGVAERPSRGHKQQAAELATLTLDSASLSIVITHRAGTSHRQDFTGPRPSFYSDKQSGKDRKRQRCHSTGASLAP